MLLEGFQDNWELIIIGKYVAEVVLVDNNCSYFIYNIKSHICKMKKKKTQSKFVTNDKIQCISGKKN